jgi:acetyltransferase-like isoleucine patch superfamily enzyme
MGNYNIIYSGSIIGHDTQIGNNNFFSTVDVGSENVIGDGVFIGMNSTVRGFLNIGDYAFIGMGSNVVSNVYSHQVVFGNPAKPKKEEVAEL